MSSSILSTQNGSAQRVPAWKRLGLKLKGATADDHEQSTFVANKKTSLHSASPQATFATSTVAEPNGAASTPVKRKSPAGTEADRQAKKPRKGESTTAQTSLLKTPQSQTKTSKHVSFAARNEEFPSPASATTASGKKLPKKEKQKQSPSELTGKKASPARKSAATPLSKKTSSSSVNLEPALEYLRQWHTARDQWKFNKNLQTKLLENAFAIETTIPAFDVNIFYEYIKPLKGFVRKRLRESAAEVKEKDMEQGAKAFSSASKEVAERKQREYEQVIAGFMNESRTPEKRRFEEVEYVLRTADMEMQRRVVKRMRAEMVIEDLSGSEDSETTTSTTTSNGTESRSGSSGQQEANGVGDNADGDKRLKMNDGSQRRVRRSKVRTAEVDDDSSSSDSSSDSESDESETSSSGSSSEDSDSDEEMVLNPGAGARLNAAETSSSSSSSSSSDEDSSSEDDSE